MDDNDILTLEEAMAYLKVGRNKMLFLAKSGEVPAKKIGKSWRFSRRKLKEYVEFSTGTSDTTNKKKIKGNFLKGHNSKKEQLDQVSLENPQYSSDDNLDFNEFLKIANNKKNK